VVGMTEKKKPGRKKKVVPLRPVETVAQEIEARGLDVRQATVKREVFAQAYTETLSAEEAALQAGISPYSAGEGGMAYRNEPRVKQRILELMDERAIRTGITADKVLYELALVAFHNVKDVFEWDEFGARLKLRSSEDLDEATAASIKEIWKDENGFTRVKFYDKTAALDKIARHLGMFTQRVEIEAKITGRVEVSAGLGRLSDGELLNLRELAEKMALPERSEVVEGEPTKPKED
jgi:phage terminase small subunit